MNYEYRTSSGYGAIGCDTEQNRCQNYMIQLPGIYFIGYGAMEGDNELLLRPGGIPGHIIRWQKFTDARTF